MIPQVKQILSRIEKIHERKNQDYAQEDNKFSNFERAAIISSWFSDPVDKVFATMIGIKLARLAELKNGKVPKNESVDDTFLDQSTYSILWMAYYEAELEKCVIKNETNKVTLLGEWVATDGCQCPICVAAREKLNAKPSR